MFQYNAVETQRYTLCQAVRLWIRHPRNRDHFQSDCLIASLLTFVTIGLITVCLLGMNYFVAEGDKLGINGRWMKTGIYLFLFIVIVGFFVTIYLLIKDEFMPWYNWWKTTVDVKLLLSPIATDQTVV